MVTTAPDAESSHALAITLTGYGAWRERAFKVHKACSPNPGLGLFAILAARSAFDIFGHAGTRCSLAFNPRRISD